MSTGQNPVAEARGALKEIEKDLADLRMYSTDYTGEVYQMPSVGQRRRSLRRGEPDPVATVSLVRNEEAALLWREGAQTAELAGKRRAYEAAAPAEDGELVELYQFEKLEANAIGKFLSRLDRKLNLGPGGDPDKRPEEIWGLWRLEADGSRTLLDAPPTGNKRRLLFVHGTFSKCGAFLDGFDRAPDETGGHFLESLRAHYQEILLFEHPTLSISPMINGYDLALAMRDATGDLDIVAHSRGGLVVRWFLEGFGVRAGRIRAVLAGVPLAGTSLAAPARLRDSLSVLSNIGNALKASGSVATLYFPLLAAPLALLKVATSIVSVTAKTPVIDAAVSMIPGLAAQSNVIGNEELMRVRRFKPHAPPQYFVIQSNFEAEDVGWKFWRWFRGERLADTVTNRIFPHENDLVVDTASMSAFVDPASPLAGHLLHNFGTTNKVHHVNYFEQKETLDFIRESLKIP